jgi:hypothetical protein
MPLPVQWSEQWEKAAAAVAAFLQPNALKKMQILKKRESYNMVGIFMIIIYVLNISFKALFSLRKKFVFGNCSIFRLYLINFIQSWTN